MALQAIPDGYHSITPTFSTQDPEKAVAFFQKAFGAEVRVGMKGPDGKLVHCEMQIADSRFMFGPPMDGKPRGMNVMLYVPNCEAAFKRAVGAGAEVIKGIEDQFYGDRTARLQDPFGNEWYLGTHVEDVSEQEMERRFALISQGKPWK